MVKLLLTPILIVLLFLSGTQYTIASSARIPIRVQIVLSKIAPLLENEKYQEAIALLTEFKARKKDTKPNIGDHPEINFALGNCHMFLEQVEEARIWYSRTVKSDKNHLPGWQNLARTEYELDNFLAASVAFHTAYDLTDNKKADLLYYSAVNLLMADELQECLTQFDTLLQRHPADVTLEWKENLVHALIQADKPRKALKYIKELATNFTGEKQERWQEILLQQYMVLDMPREAIALAHILTRKDPTNPKWWKSIVHIQLQEDRLDKALAAMTIYSYLSPLKPDEEKLLGDLFMQQGVPKKAVTHYTNYSEKKNNPQTVESLISAYLSLGETEQALRKLKKFGTEFPEQKYEMLQGEIYYVQKEYKQAAIHYGKAAKAEGKHAPRAFLMTAYCYWQQGKTKEALEHFYNAAKTAQFKKEAEGAIKILEQAI